MTTATLNDDGTVTLNKSAWSETFGIEELAGRLNLYRGLRDREQGMYASIYQDTVEALEEVERKVRK